MPSLAPRLRFPLQPLSRPARLWAAVLGAACAAALLLVATDARADDAEAQKPEAPYFFVASDDPSTDRLPLKSTEVEVRIAGVIADVTVTQRYRNEGQRDRRGATRGRCRSRRSSPRWAAPPAAPPRSRDPSARRRPRW